MRCERGYTTQLPDLVGWARPSAPVALIAESGGRREDRQKMILEGWRDAIWSGKYAAVRYDCASTSVAHWIARLAKKVGLQRPRFTAVVQPTAHEIAALSAADAHEPTVDESRLPADAVHAIGRPKRAAPAVRHCRMARVEKGRPLNGSTSVSLSNLSATGSMPTA